ncbi:universal stress protein [Acidocella sp.]|uniref:universal stress protein n=1 Tax=Acidocella sp. TaxID=50710 RepID=UPI002603CA87|nr:universal stress protein [Acidocella sp.]
MSEVVLALLTRPEAAPAVLAAAAHLAELAGGARIEALVCRTPPLATILVTEDVLTSEQEREIRAQENARAAALHEIFADWAARQPGPPPPRWLNEEGAAAALVKHWGERADYIVASPPPAHATRPEYDTLHAALFDCARPVLLMPPHASATFGKTIAVAWRDDKFTLHAVMAALRIAPKSADIHVLMGQRDGVPRPQIPDVLREHGVPVTRHELAVEPAPFGAQLLAKAHEVNADLLVMGAFVHNAWRNLLFGGVTRYMLAHADLPVLMRH